MTFLPLKYKLEEVPLKYKLEEVKEIIERFCDTVFSLWMEEKII